MMPARLGGTGTPSPWGRDQLTLEAGLPQQHSVNSLLTAHALCAGNRAQFLHDISLNPHYPFLIGGFSVISR